MRYVPNGRERFRRFRVAGPILRALPQLLEGAVSSPDSSRCPYCDHGHVKVMFGGNHIAAHGCPNGCEVNVRESIAHLVTDAEELPSR